MNVIYQTNQVAEHRVKDARTQNDGDWKGKIREHICIWTSTDCPEDCRLVSGEEVVCGLGTERKEDFSRYPFHSVWFLWTIASVTYSENKIALEGKTCVSVPFWGGGEWPSCSVLRFFFFNSFNKYFLPDNVLDSKSIMDFSLPSLGQWQHFLVSL